MKKYAKRIVTKFVSSLMRIQYAELFKDDGWLSKVIKWHKFFLRIHVNISIDMIISGLLLSVRNRTSCDPIEYKNVRNSMIVLFEKSNDEKKFYLSKIFYYFEMMDEIITCLIIDFARTTKNPSYRYWTTMDVSRFTFLLQKGFYPEYFNDRKELMKQICEDMHLIVPPLKEKDTKNKLCIITHLLTGGLENSVTRCVNMFARGMASEFDEIMIFPLDTFAPGNTELKELTTVLTYPISQKFENEISLLFSENSQVYFSSSSLGYREKMQEILNAIYNYNPAVIVDMSDEYSAISYIYSKDFLTIYQPFRSGNSSSFYNYIIGRRWKFQALNEKYHSVELNKVIDWSFPEYVPELQNAMTKEDIGFEKKDFIIVCSGNNETCCDNLFVDEISRLLEKNDFLKLLFVGQNAPEYFHVKYPHLFLDRKIIEWGYEKNLYGLYCACDVLIRPNMTGGSGATAIAALAGLPLAMTNYVCDASRWLGLDFSNSHNYRQVMDYIESMSKDHVLYEQEKTKVEELVKSAIDTPEKWKCLRDLISKAGRRDLT